YTLHLTPRHVDYLHDGMSKRIKDKHAEYIDHNDTHIGTTTTAANASSLKKYNDQLLDLFADVLFNPAFPQSELDKLKKQAISGLAAAKEDPNSIVGVVRNAVMYGKDHPYGETETEKTVQNVQVEDIEHYYNTYFKPNIAYLAIVGDITVQEAKTLVDKYFSDWESGDVPKHEWPTPQAPT